MLYVTNTQMDPWVEIRVHCVGWVQKGRAGDLLALLFEPPSTWLAGILHVINYVQKDNADLV